MNIVAAIPLFTYLLIAFNIMIFTADMPAALHSELLAVNLMSGARWSMTGGDLLVMFGVVALFVEMLKATRTTTASVVDHMLSTLVFIVFVVEFVTVKGAGNSTFLVIGLMSLLDVIAGFTITIVSARRDFTMGEPH